MSKSGGIAYLLKHGRAPFPTVTRTEMPRMKGVKRMAEGGLPNANAPLNYGTVPDYVFVPGGMAIDERTGKPVWKSGRYELRSPAPVSASAPTDAVGVPRIGTSADGGRDTPAPSGWDKMTATEKAAYYAANPTMAAITQFGQKAFGLTSLGALSRALDPVGWKTNEYIAQGIDPLGPEGYGTGGGSFAGMGPSGNETMSLGDQYSSYGAGRQAAEQAVSGAAAAQAAADTQASIDSSVSESQANDARSAGGDYGWANGGIIALAGGGQTQGPRLLSGGGDGLSDGIPAVIGKNQPARLADGEFVVSADVVSALGGGSTKAGAKKLYDMMDRIRQNAHGTKKQVKKVNERKVLPA